MLNCTVTSQLAHFRFRRNRFCSEAVAPLRCTAVAQMVMMCDDYAEALYEDDDEDEDEDYDDE